MEPIYYESHITTSPIMTHIGIQKFEEVCARYRFRAAKLLMQKGRPDTWERSNKDAFCTGRSKDYDELFQRMNDLAADLVDNGFTVWRKKIEAVIFDEKTNETSNN